MQARGMKYMLFCHDTAVITYTVVNKVSSIKKVSKNVWAKVEFGNIRVDVTIKVWTELVFSVSRKRLPYFPHKPMFLVPVP